MPVHWIGTYCCDSHTVGVHPALLHLLLLFALLFFFFFLQLRKKLGQTGYSLCTCGICACEWFHPLLKSHGFLHIFFLSLSTT